MGISLRHLWRNFLGRINTWNFKINFKELNSTFQWTKGCSCQWRHRKWTLSVSQKLFPNWNSSNIHLTVWPFLPIFGKQFLFATWEIKRWSQEHLYTLFSIAKKKYYIKWRPFGHSYFVYSSYFLYS